MEQKSLLTEYLQHLNRAQQKYGPKVAVLMQNGKFYEIYGLTSEKAGNIEEIADVLNILVTRNDKSKPMSRSNYQKAGFPMDSVDRHRDRLVEYGYKVVIIDQTGENADGTKVREITEIVSSATNTSSSAVNNYLLALLMDQDGGIGMTLIDAITGRLMIDEYRPDPTDTQRPLDNVYHIIQSYNPCEILLFHMDTTATPTEWSSDDLQYLQIDTHPKVCRTEIDPRNHLVSLQNHFLQSIYPHTGMVTPIEYLDLAENQTATICLIEALRYVKDMNPALVHMFPGRDMNRYEMFMPYNAISQLNLVSNTDGGTMRSANITSVYDVMREYVQTPMGERLLHEYIVRPVTKSDLIAARHSIIRAMLQENSSSTVWAEYYNIHFRKMRDIEKLHRRLATRKISPADLIILRDALQKLQETFDNSGIPCEEPSAPDSEIEMILHNLSVFCEDRCPTSMSRLSGNIFNSGYSERLDELCAQLEEYPQYCSELCDKLQLHIRGRAAKAFEINLEEGTISTTVARWRQTEPILHEMGEEPVVVERNKAHVKWRTKYISDNYGKWRRANSETTAVISDHYLDWLSTKGHDLCQPLSTVVKYVATMDVAQSQAMMVKFNNYCLPEMQDYGENGSHVDIKGLRHPIIELINKKTRYITHDVALGKAEHDGWLLYGLNGVGKSSVMKALGVAVTLAQGGLAVPAGSCSLSPFKTLLTRIIGNDNLFKSKSTFEVEMHELNSILRRSCSHTLVLGDELCHGTEVDSQLALIVATVSILAREKRSKFVIATHNHSVGNHPLIKELPKVRICHLASRHTSSELVYDRHILDGVGDIKYGIEVAEALGLPADAIALAYSIRSSSSPPSSSSSSPTVSRYNKEVVLDKCAICQSPAEHSHHIVPQRSRIGSSKRGDGGVILDSEHNLVPLCEKCHHKVHSGDIQIDGYVKTSHGVRLRHYLRDE